MMITDNSRREEFEDRHTELEQHQQMLTAFAEEKHAEDTRAAYRRENGEEMDEFEGGNLNDQAAIDAFDEEDASTSDEIDGALRGLDGRIAQVDNTTPVAVNDAIGHDLEEVADMLAERARKLGYQE